MSNATKAKAFTQAELGAFTDEEDAASYDGAKATRPETSDPIELACRKAADDLHALLLRALYARTRGDSNAIRELLDGDNCLIARQTLALNEAFNAAGLGDPFTT